MTYVISSKPKVLTCPLIFGNNYQRSSEIRPLYGLLMLLALTIVSTMQVVGVILVVVMLIASRITALTLTNLLIKCYGLLL
ncbi:metal ABC transporter permease [Moraxella catarrhalis]|uniref:metal ABC transporter permease n=1 Tax=Moraxella catarrhalis TaxID=480 RepID=UPI0034D1F38E